MSQSEENPWEKVGKCPFMKVKWLPSGKPMRLPDGPLKFCDTICLKWYDECVEFKREAKELIGE